MEKTITCYGQLRWSDHVQEWYESASGDSRIRAKDLRRRGLRVYVGSQGTQVTPVGLVKMTLLTACGTSDQIDNLPPVRIERM